MTVRKTMHWLAPAACAGVGLFLLRMSYRAHAKWWEYMSIGDSSGAEVYEVEFWPEAILAVALLLVGGFLAGRSRSR